MRRTLIILLGFGLLVSFVIVMMKSGGKEFPTTPSKPRTTALSALEVAQELLMTVKVGQDPTPFSEELCSLGEEDMRGTLTDDRSKRAFWLNVYNAFGQLLLEQEPVDLRDADVRTAHYGTRRICVAGRRLSLNDIEHGMLRGSLIWWSKGYLAKWSSNAFEQDFRVPVDARIHFALNCGAASCPAIAFYDADHLGEQLDLAVRVYLKDDVAYDRSTNTVRISALFDWYANDFGGPSGTLDFLRKYGLIPTDAEPELVFNEYDWTVLTRSFRDQAS